MVSRSVLNSCVVPPAGDRADLAQQPLEGLRPVLLGAEQQPDQVLRAVSHSELQGRKGQQNRGRWWASCLRHQGQS